MADRKHPSVSDDPLWYKDAVIYQVHVRGFFDSNDDGIGDFVGLTRKLDYIQSLGVSAIWLQPFYPSPLKDDGYDIAQYTGINPSYGTRRDFTAFMNEAHERGIRVITELVINHTSDQHPWFQAARRAKRGSPKRDFYVWSDTDTKYAGVPIVFKDTERSNWAWDPIAGQYYWHRFFSHQPDLNFDNPQVRKAVLKVMRFWLDQGVDGMRLDAVPYLVEREGTQCANLPETHAVLKEIRREMDARYANRMLLAEANQWPSDVRAYFGDNDECHMAFHFPLMPRLYMALRQEDRHPLSEILWQMPEIPDACQWAIFLRNHDELTLEMVSDEERDYMYQTYAADPQMRLNAGIRRRLAPLMENSRSTIELLTGLLLSLPGTPVLYYGDELGMGDNVYLGDRNGVRTPMQWTADRNGGFSRADPARLYAPPIMDPVYGYQSVNVEAQERSPHSLLNWMRRTIGLRQRHSTFGKGQMELLRPLNRRVFAFIRRLDPDDPILVVANLSRTMQAVSLDLARFSGLVPVEMSGGVDLPRITDAPYVLTLGPHAFYWLKLQRDVPSPLSAKTVAPGPEINPEQSPLLIGPEWWKVLDGSVRHLLERLHLVPFLRRQQWVEPRAAALTAATITDWGTLRNGDEPILFLLLNARYADGAEIPYAVPMAVTPGERGDEILRHTPEAVVAQVAGARKGVLHARLDVGTGLELLRSISGSRGIPLRKGRLNAKRLIGYDMIGLPDRIDDLPAAPFDAERFHSTAPFGERVLLKVIRRVWPGTNPERELGEGLRSNTDFHRVPAVAGEIEYVDESGISATVALANGYVPHQSDAWRFTLVDLERYFDLVLTLGEPPAAAANLSSLWGADVPQSAALSVGAYLQTASTLGQRSAALHRALAAIGGTAATRTMQDADVDALGDRVRRRWRHTREALAAAPDLHELATPVVATLLGRGDDIEAAIAAALGRVTPGAQLSRVHGSLDLAHVLVHEGDFTFIGLGDESHRSIDERQALRSPLEDVASALRSFHTAIEAGLAARHLIAPHDADRLAGWARAWTAAVVTSFLASYRLEAASTGIVPDEPAAAAALLWLYQLEQQLAEIELNMIARRAWLPIAVNGTLDLLPELDSRPSVGGARQSE